MVAMNPEEAYSDYKAFVHSMGTGCEEVENPISEGEFEGKIIWKSKIAYQNGKVVL